MDRIIEFFTNFYRDEPIYFWIAVALAAVLVILIIALIIAGISRSAKKKRARAAAEKAAAQISVQPTETKPAAQPVQDRKSVV